jgi:Uma2 family endonuclease
MSAALKPKLTVAEYLARERTAEVRGEFLGGEVIPVPRTSREHNRLKENLVGEIGTRLKGGPCRTYSSTQRVNVSATGLYTYPDIAIVCGRAEYDPADRDTLVNPVAVIEVLSPATESYDRGAKFRQYQQIPSFKEYVLVSQDDAVVERFVRQADDTWVLTVLTGLTGDLTFATVPVQIPLADIYRGIDFPPTPTPGGRPG